MEMYNATTQLVSSVGFPIAMCLGLLWYIVQQAKEHKQETSDFVKALNNNTLVLQKLCDKLDIEMENR